MVGNMGTSSDIAKQVEDRAKNLLPPEEKPELERKFVKQCLDANERGDGVLFASFNQNKYLQNVTAKNKEWYVWGEHVWEPDYYNTVVDAVEDCALEYQIQYESLKNDVAKEGITSKHPDSWKIQLQKKYDSRVTRLRSESGAKKALFWAPVVQPAMACKESDFNQHNWLLPVKNGVVDLKTGTLTNGRPEDLMTKALDVEYDPHADYSLWLKILQEISGSENEIPGFLKRSIGYAATGFTDEQYIWIFLGPGRNGKGVFFSMINEILGPFFHTLNPAMLLEQRNPPSPGAASEHLYSLFNKRLILGSETNKGQKIDGGNVKKLTGQNDITCRPNFGSEFSFYPTHTMMLETNNIPFGLTQEFSLRERLLLIDFPFRYVDDVEAHQKKEPMFSHLFRQKDKHLLDKLREIRPGILRWIVEGCQEWQEHGLAAPRQVKEAVEKLRKEEDYIGRFVESCLLSRPDDVETRIPCKTMYSAFKWWWSENEGVHEKRIPAMKTINKGLRERGFVVDAKGGVTWIFGCHLSLDVVSEVEEYAKHSR